MVIAAADGATLVAGPNLALATAPELADVEMVTAVASAQGTVLDHRPLPRGHVVLAWHHAVFLVVRVVRKGVTTTGGL